MADGLLDTPVAATLLGAARDAGLDLATTLQGGDDDLRPTEVAQPALLLVEAALADLLPPDIVVVGVAGHSVGEYAAALAAGALTCEDAMRLVVTRGRAMAAMRQGTMVALLGADVDTAQAICDRASGTGAGVVVIANINAPGQVVLSGTREAVDAAAALAREHGVRKVVPLNVSGAFHSPLMEEAATLFATHLAETAVRAPRVPIACNVDGAAVTDAEGLRDRLRRQLTGAVRWTDCIATLAELRPDVLLEVGPGSVLTGLARRIAPDIPALAVGSREAAAQLLDRLTATASS